MSGAKQSTRVAVGGFSAALCFVVMMLSGILPLMTYALPAMAGVMLLPCAVELGKRTALTAYVAVSLLGILMLPDKETAMMFVAFFGYYPIAKFWFEKIRNGFLKLCAKLLLFNTAMISSYLVLIQVLGLAYLIEEFNSPAFAGILLLLGNIFFLLYDYTLNSALSAYHIKFRKMLFKH